MIAFASIARNATRMPCGPRSSSQIISKLVGKAGVFVSFRIMGLATVGCSKE